MILELNTQLVPQLVPLGRFSPTTSKSNFLVPELAPSGHDWSKPIRN
jgi:hypothetical protein